MLADVVTAVQARMPGFTINVGKKFLVGNGVLPRIIFVPTRDTFTPAQRTNGTVLARQDGSGNKTFSGRQLFVRSAGVEVHVWGADIAATEALVHQFLGALHNAVAQDLDITQIAPKGYRLLDGGWLADAWTSQGEVWMGNVEFQFPVNLDPNPTAVVTDFPETPEIETPGNPPTEEDDS